MMSTKFAGLSGSAMWIECAAGFACLFAAYSPLVQCSSFEIVGALPFGDERMRCRVRVKPAGSSSAPFAVADPVCIFNWSLSKQTTKRWPDDPLLGCWMVDGVMPE